MKQALVLQSFETNITLTVVTFLFWPLLQFTINVSTDMRHHRVRLLFQDSPLQCGKKKGDHGGLQVVLDPVQSVRVMDWWHPQYPSSHHT